MKHLFWSMGLIAFVASISAFAIFMAVLSAHHFQIRFAHHQALKQNIVHTYPKETMYQKVMEIFNENYKGGVIVEKFDSVLYPNAIRFRVKKPIGGYTYALERLMIEEPYET